MLRFFSFFGLLLGFITVVNAQHAEVAQANTYFKSFLFKEAIPLYEDALQKDPYLGDAMVNLAKCYYYTNKPKEAALWYARILRYDGYKQYAFDYGKVLKMTGQYSEAKRWFRESMRNNSTRGTHYSNSCDFALQPNPLDDVFNVVALPAINSKSADFAPTFHYNQLIFASSRSIAVTKNGDVAWTNDAFNQHYLAEATPQKEWIGAQVLRSYIGNDINDAPMSYAPTEDLVVITSNNFMDGIRHIDGSGLMMDLYLYKTKSVKEWDVKTQKFFPFNANVETKQPYSTGHPCLADKGMTLYFCSNRPGGYGGYDIYKSRRTATGWGVPENLGHPINTAGNEMSPFVDADGRLYFASDWHHGYGGLDIFMANRAAYGWGAVKNLGKQVNSPADDLYFTFDVASKVGYFTSNRAGGRGHEDIYQVRQQRALPKRQIARLGVGTKFILDDRYFKAGDGSLHNTSDRQLYDILQRLIDNPTTVVQINGYTDAVGSASSNLALSKERASGLASFFVVRGIQSNRIKVAGYGESFLVNDCGDNRRCTSEERAANRRLEVVVIGNLVNNVVNITYDAAPAPNADKIVQDAVAMAVASKQVVRSSSSSSKSRSSYKKPERKDHYAIGDKIEVASVFYEHGKSSIDHKKSPGLKELLDILNQHQHVVVEIGAHTDASGTAKYNRELSEKRAISVKKYLEKKGIPSSRLVARGYGESQLLNGCKDGVRCSKEENAINRRTEFKIIGQKGFKVGDIIKVDNINYELNKAKLDMADSRGLTEVIQLLKDNQISVEIRSHTDARGTSSYNEELSQKRAKAVYDHLVKSGISKHRLKYKGYGESKLLNKCKDGVRCSSSEHAENRRTDFRVIGLR